MSAAGVVIVGGGLAGQRCAETLRRRGFGGRIAMVCGEPVPPYDRPPLSKGLLAGSVDVNSVWLRPSEWYADNHVELLLGVRGIRLDPARHVLVVSGGRRVRYDRILIATGSRPRELPFLGGYSNVHTVRTIFDVQRLRPQLAAGARLAIVGAGFIGQEIAATAVGLGVSATVIEAQPAPLAAILGERVGAWFAELHRSQGVRVLAPAMLDGARGRSRVEELVLADGRTIKCDVVVVGVGVALEMDWLGGTGLPTADGIPTRPDGHTALPDVYAAGDVAAVFEPRLGLHRRTEHWDAAARGGAAAARAMLGATGIQAPPLPSFWSDQYGLRVSYVGHAEAADEHRVEGDPDERSFTVVYERDRRPVAALAVGQPRRLAELRREIELGNAHLIRQEEKEKAA
jgi:NADPH-dependent 2,4-dienoyl-CoA reductase/sulfur reductase-like enzyme